MRRKLCAVRAYICQETVDVGVARLRRDKLLVLGELDRVGIQHQFEVMHQLVSVTGSQQLVSRPLSFHSVSVIVSVPDGLHVLAEGVLGSCPSEQYAGQKRTGRRGKKLESKEVKMTILALLSLPLSILGWTALATVLPPGLAGIANTGPHGFSEILYAYTSGTGNNGSAFAGISANTLFYNTTIAGAMLMGRFIFVIPLLAVAGSLVQKKLLAPSAGTFPTNRPLFVGLLVGVVLIIGGLTYFPAISLGPTVEQVAMNQGKAFPAP